MNSKMKIMDGCKATTYVAYGLSEIATIYPITPVEDMGELANEWGVEGRTNILGQPMIVRELESELGAAGAAHGALSGGALTTTFTNSQGLLLMIPNMYKIAGELLPGVFHVATRSLSSHALSIFGDHQDVMACRHTGFAFLASASVQECMDLSIVAHMAALEGSVPFCHFFDGWRTSGEMQTINTVSYKDMIPLFNKNRLQAFRQRAMNPEHPNVRGTAENEDVYFQNREACNLYYDALPAIVEKYMHKVSKITGRDYNLFDYVGAPDAEYIIISIGSSCEVIEETLQYLLKKGYKVGAIKVRLYRPFSTKHLIEAIPSSVKRICVLDRTKEPGAVGEPLYEDVCTALHVNQLNIPVIGGRYGLSSKDFTPSMVKAIYDEMKKKNPKHYFTIGIEDDVTHLSLKVNDNIITTPSGTIQCKFYGMGSDGTVGATKQAANIIGNNTDLYTQAYFLYSAKKSGGYTISELRFGKEPIKSSYLIEQADYIGCNKDTYVRRFDVLNVIKDGGTFVLNSSWSLEEMEKQLPAYVRRTIAKKNIKFYNIDAVKIANEVGLGVRINMIMETVFLKLTNVLDFNKAVTLLKEDIKNIYIKEGEDVVQKNYDAVDKAVSELVCIDYPASWKEAKDVPQLKQKLPDFIKYVARPIMSLQGNSLPVSLFNADGFTPVGTTKYEKRCIATSIPVWDPEKCVQCCHCSFVCAHATIRPFLATDEELNSVPTTFKVTKATGDSTLKELKFRIQVYPEDCLGCGSCVNICPGKALTLEPISTQIETEKVNLEFALSNISLKDDLLPRNSVKGSQFQQPLLEFSGACAACGETPYVKLLTQLFGERMIIANATGCSSIWGANMPSMAYTKNKNGHGPAWGNSLFEDNAEYGYGIGTAIKYRRQKLEMLVDKALQKEDLAPMVESALNEWKINKNDAVKSHSAGRDVVDALATQTETPLLKAIQSHADLLGKKSIWAIGGDGWAYDIGFAGLDHVLASNLDINILVMDTECYSNTGGQTSKATPLGAIAGYSANGKRTNRKQLGRMMMMYGNVYVASICLGADMQQAVTAISEAEAYDGPSIVIAYCPCINHGIRNGMGMDIIEEAHAVQCGYWPLYRYNPDLRKEGKSPLTVDYHTPNNDLLSFINGEDRYADLKTRLPEIANILQPKLKQNCDNLYSRMTKEEMDNDI